MKIATLCYIHNGDKVLMMHRNKRQNDRFKGYWNGVGGKANENESPEECVIREVWEETGLTITRPNLKGILTFPNNLSAGETWYVFVFNATDFTGELTENDEGSLEWVTESRVSKLTTLDADKHFMKWLKKDGVFSAKFTYHEGVLKDLNVAFYA